MRLNCITLAAALAAALAAPAFAADAPAAPPAAAPTTAAAPAPAAAPAAPSFANIQFKPFELNPDRFQESGVKTLGKSTTYYIPSVTLLLSVHGEVWAQKKGAQAVGKFFVDGVSKEYAQALAKTLHDDLVTKMRAAGYTVKTFDDMKDDPEVAKRDRLKPNERWGLPIRKDMSGSTKFVVAAPTDAQAFEVGLTGPVHSYMGFAKEKDLVMIVPEYWFTAPQMGAEVSEGYKRATAGIVIEPAMKLYYASIYFVGPKKDSGYVFVQIHGKRLASESAGTVEQTAERKSDMGVLLDYEWKRTSSDFGFTIDPTAYAAGVLRVGYAINDMIVQKAKKAH